MKEKFADLSETYTYSKVQIGQNYLRNSEVQRPSIDPNAECGFKVRKNSN